MRDLDTGLEIPQRSNDIQYKFFRGRRSGGKPNSLLPVQPGRIELIGICDRIYTLSEGRITGELPAADATPEALIKLMTMEKAR